MHDRIEICYRALDEMGSAILHNRIPTATEIFDNNLGDFIPASWPESFDAWKEKVQKGERDFGREPLTGIQWKMMRLYMEAQFGLVEVEDA